MALHDDNYFEQEQDGYDYWPKCSRHYNEIDAEYQSCSKCGWDEEKGKWYKPLEPTSSDYENGDADILTGRWY